MIGVKELCIHIVVKQQKKEVFLKEVVTSQCVKIKKIFFFEDFMKKTRKDIFLENTFHLTTPHNRMRKCH